LWTAGKEKEVLSCLPVGFVVGPPIEILNNLGNDEAKNVWLTLVVLFYLEKFCKKDQGKWNLVATKAKRQLKKMGINSKDHDGDVEKLFL
jgi:hypothetical protein